jgi:predicted P-loop ATPase
MPPEQVQWVLTLGISAHVRESSNVLRYAQRQVKRALAILEARSGEWPVLSDKLLPVPHHPKNVRYALARLGVDAQRNQFNKTDEVRGAGLDGRDLNDIAEILCSQFGRELDFAATPAAIKRELLAIAHENPYHPVCDYLDGLIRRIKQPGVKFDTMLVLEGAQGAGKSQVAQLLAVRPEWFCGSLNLTSDDKSKAEMLARAWIVECQELDGLNKSTSQNLKRFLSTPTDTFRRAYGRDAGEYPRHCIIIGTTNEGAYLRDLTGNRRIWPVLVRRVDLARFGADVHQLWAEAVVREAAGESITLSPHLWAAAAEVQGQRMVEDAYADVLGDTFAELTGRVSMDSVKLLLGVDTARMSPTDTRRIKSVMAGLGWDFGTHRLHDLGRLEKIQRRGFARGDADQQKVEYIAQRIEGGIVVINRLDRLHCEDAPF